ncbi:lung adenoma susceptibility protein 2 isoform X1 [Scleropages formosus]|uniref:lung adenoma susceptibility protein 2 isoform X1 n=1 Tax=Scleropages formosus TaxID=113540 RepID=UPI0010FA8067|nr:lung adenoma susceptibility protein 2 isoform X1 [Scleropages formosus]XP_018603884.2 lung adenoma susceptibility protein 2 isoform X1 [Scleropages formosus]
MASSPESTVTLLLASSGRLKSSLFNDSTKTIRYKDREYESATEALDAYIEDFQRSLGTTESTMGEIYLRKDASTSVLTQASYRNKDVLKEKLTDLELDYLNLPVGSPKRQSDCLSLTTDDLLVLPSDGSLPITHTSAFLTESENYPLGHRSYSRSYNSSSCLQQQSQNLLVSKETVERRSHCKDQDRKDFYPLRDRAKKRLNLQTSFMSPLHSGQRKLTGANTSYQYPRWLTSGKSLMNFSGVTSIPSLTYPMWLKDFDMPADSNDYRTTQKKLQHTDTMGSPLKVPSWLAELEASYSELWKNSQWSQSGDKQKNLRTYCEEADHQTLRNLRRDFAEQVATAEENSTTYNKPFCDDKIESLILKAEKVLKSPSLGLSSLTSKSVSSPHTEDVLDADRPWDNPPVTFKAPVPIGGAEDHLNVKTPVRRQPENDLSDAEAVHSCSSGYSSRKHPGPVEALKQMLFSLQGVEQQVTRRKRRRKTSTV